MRVVARECALIASACLLPACGSKQPAADLVIRNADIRTQDARLPHASALAASDGRIVFIGNEDDIEKWIGEKTNLVDAAGNTVLPGLIDSHIHAAEAALALGGCTLRNKQLTVEQTAAPIRACLAADTTSTWLVVNEVNPAGFKANRRDLDAIESHRPLFLWGADGHTAWVNSAGLAAAKITRDTQDPDDGRIERDAKGEPTGFLVDSATGLALSVMEQPTPAKRLDALRRVLPLLHGTGITAYLEANTDEPTVAAYADLAKAGELTARVSVAFESDGENTPAEFARLEGLRKQLNNDLFRADFIKLFADGVLEYPTQTAVLLEPYHDAHGKPGSSRGKLYLSPQQLDAFVAEAGKRSFNIHVHAIGDGAVREVLDVFAKARDAGNRQLFSMAHLQLIDAADLPRFATLDVGASLQLLWAQPDNYSIDALTPWLGSGRMGQQYPAKSLLAAGVVIAGGSDWDVSSFNPFEAMATAMSRRNPEQAERAPLNPGEALTLDQILDAYTTGAASIIGRYHEIGSLAVGKRADVIVLDRKFGAETTADQVRETRPAKVFFNGREVTTARMPD
jgi:predicted amidohydrolase YtcJ